MNLKTLLIVLALFTQLFILMVTPASAAPNYELTLYDPQDDVMRVRTDEDIKFAPQDNVEVTKFTSTYISGIIPQIELAMTVEGVIRSNDSYNYIFIVESDGIEYVFEAYTNGVAVGFKLGGSALIPGVSASGEGTDTLRISFNEDSIGPPSTSYEVSGAAIYCDGYHEKYIDLVAPDKLILITEPSDGSTVNGTVIVRGVVRESTEGHPNGTVKIAIDGGPLLEVNGTNPWSYSLDTTALTVGAHTVHVEVEGAGLDNAEDEITIFVNQDVGSYPSFNQKPEPHIGDWYYYESLGPGNFSGLQMEFITELEVQVVDIENITVDGTEYEAYRIESYTESEQDFGYIAYQFAMVRISWRETDDFGKSKEYTVTIIDMVFNPEATVEKTTEFSPPLETYNDFSISMGFNNRWIFNTTADSTTQTTAQEEVTQNPPYSENIQITGECLYYKSSHRVFDGIFNDIFVIQTYYENPGMYVVEYYSPELGVPVQIDTFDPSRNLVTSLGLRTWRQMDFSIKIGNVTFNPSEPMEDSTNHISVDIQNVGKENATNLTITVTVNGKNIGEEIIALILVNETQKAIIDWIPESEGNHTIEIKTYYKETDFAEETVYIEVLPHIPSENDEYLIPFRWIFILVLIITVLLSVFILRRNKTSK